MGTKNSAWVDVCHVMDYLPNSNTNINLWTKTKFTIKIIIKLYIS